MRELKRQYHSSLYERLALSRDKKGIKALAEKGQIIETPKDAIKDPFILEFLELQEHHRYSENDLETAIINKLEHFMLELGKGFLFEGKTPDENPTIGIVLCKEDNKTVVEFTLPENNKQIFSREYKLYLPSKAELRKQLE